MAKLERDFLSLAAAAAKLQPAVAVATKAMQRIPMTPDKRRIEATEDVPIIVQSPSKRHRGKQSPSVVNRRNPKLCQAPECIFNRKHSGEPAWSPDAELCQWCDPAAMAAALQEPGQAEVRHTIPIVLRRSILEINGPQQDCWYCMSDCILQDAA